MMYALHDLQYVNDVNPKEYVKYRSSCGIFKTSSADPEIFQMGGGEVVRRKILIEKCLLIHVSTRVHIKLDKHASVSLFFLFKMTVFYFLL